MGKIVKLLAKYYPVYLSGLWGTLWISAVTVLLTAQSSVDSVLTSGEVELARS